MSETPIAAAPATLDRVRHSLVGLKMPRALEALNHVVRQIERGETPALEAIDTLLAGELTLREGSRSKAALRMARLTTVKTLQSYDFSFQPSLDRNRILALAQLDFISRHEALHLLGPPGTGKSHLAVALGVEAVRAGRSVYFSPLADIVASLARAEREGTLRERIRFLCRASLLIVDAGAAKRIKGYLPVGAGNLFFQLVNARYEHGAMILTSNRGFAEWGEVFGDQVVATALLDRLLHHAVVVQVEGASYRLRQHADLVPEVVRTRPIPPVPPRHRVADGQQRTGAPIQPTADHQTKLGNFTPAQMRNFEAALTIVRAARIRHSWRCPLSRRHGLLRLSRNTAFTIVQTSPNRVATKPANSS
ncbi:MAG: IS21-like element helper ATPase IstB [Acetobacteraceae bacterium]|nr:IS21-like element helper ATPase IstB [Acetobacteraceae bacterium]